MELNDTGDPPGEDAYGTEAASTGDEQARYRRSVRLRSHRKTVSAAAVMKSRICICVNHPEGVNQ